MRRARRWLLPLTLLLAMLLTIVPLPQPIAPWRPHWLALVMIYWQIETRALRGLGQPFALGLVLDLLTGALLGQHALGLVIINFLVGRFRNRIRFFPIWQQTLIIGAVLFNDRIVNLWIVGLVERGWPGWNWWLPPLTAMLLWPWLYLAMDRMRLAWRTGR
ncbi:MAG: rod shape-determining protein MreD [Wenzhouxiangellaceae bacterium]|nr:rod shape-determining protein MreD [Wenzhouxiangellaceae bacterium]